MSPQSLSEMQAYVAQVEIDRGFAGQSAETKCLLLGEEVGELFKAVRRSSGVGIDAESEQHEVADELADVLIFVLAIANRFDVDLTQAFANKEIRNSMRVWAADTPQR